MNSLEQIITKTTNSCEQYLRDESRLAGGNAEEVFFPVNAAQVSDIIRQCNNRNIPFTVYGKGTGITGGAVPFGGAVISLDKMKKLSRISADEKTGKFFVKADAGVTLNDLKEMLKRKEYLEISNGCELFYPVDPTEMGASIGGTVATNASGASSFRYGPTRNWIKSVDLVLPDGELIHIERGKCFADASGMLEINGKRFKIPQIEMPQCKNAAGLYSKPGMDLIDIFIGSEGILGVVTTIEIWLERKYPSFSVIKFLKNEQSAFDFVSALRKSTELNPVFIEYVDEKGLNMLRKKRFSDKSSINIPEIEEQFKTAVFFDILLDSMDIVQVAAIIGKIETELGVFDDMSWCAWEEIEIERIKAFRHALPETVNTAVSEIKKDHPSIHKLGTDMAVPEDKFRLFVSYCRELLDESGLNYVAFGHIGNDHLHINIIPENESELQKGSFIYKKFAEKAVKFKGTVSAEHGIGKIKHNYLVEMYGKEGIAEMRRIKSFFDPEFLLNRGNMFEYMEKP